METEGDSSNAEPSRRKKHGLRYHCARCGTEYGGMRARCPYCGEGNHRHPVVITLAALAVIAALAVVIFVIRKIQSERRDDAAQPPGMPVKGTSIMQ